MLCVTSMPFQGVPGYTHWSWGRRQFGIAFFTLWKVAILSSTVRYKQVPDSAQTTCSPAAGNRWWIPWWRWQDLPLDFVKLFFT